MSCFNPMRQTGFRLAGRLCGLLALSALACVSTLPNVAPSAGAEAQPILAGRLEFYRNDRPVSCPTSGYYLILDRPDAPNVKLRPDRDCFVYVPVSPGSQNLAIVTHKSFATGDFVFSLDPFPSTEISPDDTVVNFCTLTINFLQSTGSKVSAALVGSASAQISVKARNDCDETRQAIAEKLAYRGPIRDAGVAWFHRVR